MLRAPLTIFLGILTALAAVPSAIRLLGDHEQRPLVIVVVLLPYFVVPLVVLLALQVLLRRTWLAGVTAAVLVLNALWFVPLYVSNAVPKGRAVIAMTANLKFGKADAADLVANVKDHGVDVLATEELTPEEVTRLRAAGLDRILRYHDLLPAEGPDGTGIWSRWPLVAQPAWPQRFHAPGALVQMPGGAFVVRAVHAVAPVGSGSGYRADTAGIIAKVHALPAMPSIVLGDFNASLDTSFLRSLRSSRFRDAGDLAGSGFQRTWGPESFDVLDLDHVFVDHRFGATSTTVVDLPGSDHDGVIARLVLS